MICKVNFRVTLDKTRYKPREKKNYYDFSPLITEYAAQKEGYHTDLAFPFIPFVGMHIGDSQLITICQVYYLGQAADADGNKVPMFRADCQHISDPYHHSFDGKEFEQWGTKEMEDTIRKISGMTWEFKESKESC